MSQRRQVERLKQHRTTPAEVLCCVWYAEMVVKNLLSFKAAQPAEMSINLG